MKRVKSILKYTVFGLLAILLFAAIGLTYFIFKNKAPIISGDIKYGLPYKNELKLDIYTPTKKVFEVSPVVFYIHGGAWITGNKITINNSRFNGAVNTLREKGYTIICPDYTLAMKGKSPFPDCIMDVYEAIDWTKKNAGLYGLDTSNMGLLGESAGAQIAMMIAFADTALEAGKYKKPKFNYLIDVYGPNDLDGIYHSQLMDKLDSSINNLPKSLRTRLDLKQYLFGFEPRSDSIKAKEMLYKYSPLKCLAENDFAVLIIHGKNDQLVPVEQSIVLKSKLDELCIPNEMHLLDNVEHGFINANQSQMDSVQMWISDFVLNHYNKKNKK